MNRKLLYVAFAMLILIAGVGSVFAGSAAVNGTLDGGDPTLLVALIVTPNCTGGYGVTNVHYEAHPFTVDASGSYNFTVTSAAAFASLYVYQGSFDPANAANCYAASNSGTPTTLNGVALTAGTQYFAVVFDDQFAQAGGDYTLNIDGPGNINFAGTGGCSNPLPPNSVVYDVPAGAPAFFAPDLQSQTNFNLPAGTWKIVEFSGDFAKVWIACEAAFIWIPANAVGAAIG